MDKKDIKISDLTRILLGEAPATFLLETLFRTIIMYLFVLLIIRLLGKRMSGELTITELSLVIMFGAIIAPAMQIPERGIATGVLVLFLILFFHWVVARGTTKSKKFETAISGEISILLKDGVLQLDALRNEQITREQLFAMLRGKKIYQSGAVKRVYLESNGEFSIYKADDPQPGLSLLPSNDDEIQRILKEVAHIKACRNCGIIYQNETPSTCSNCSNNIFEPAVKEKEQEDEKG